MRKNWQLLIKSTILWEEVEWDWCLQKGGEECFSIGIGHLKMNGLMNLRHRERLGMKLDYLMLLAGLITYCTRSIEKSV